VLAVVFPTGVLFKDVAVVAPRVVPEAVKVVKAPEPAVVAPILSAFKIVPVAVVLVNVVKAPEPAVVAPILSAFKIVPVAVVLVNVVKAPVLAVVFPTGVLFKDVAVVAPRVVPEAVKVVKAPVLAVVFPTGVLFKDVAVVAPRVVPEAVKVVKAPEPAVVAPILVAFVAASVDTPPTFKPVPTNNFFAIATPPAVVIVPPFVAETASVVFDIPIPPLEITEPVTELVLEIALSIFIFPPP
jgi:hypothetical protein